MAGLEEVGIPGSTYLREALTSCTDPLQAIEEFQNQNGILLPSLNPALPLLDLHGINRLEFHSSVVEELREKLLKQIAEISVQGGKVNTSKLVDVLEKSFPLVKVPELQPVIMHVLKHLPKIKPSYLKQILDTPELYTAASVEVKRQIWEDNQSLFGDEVSPLLKQYIQEREQLLFNPESEHKTIYDSTPKARRQTKLVNQLTQMVGKSVKLYDMVLQFLRTLFLRTRNPHYCTLRSELLMSLHDCDVHEICSVDPCHKFAWCLDPCIREKLVDAKRTPELQKFLDGLKKQQEQVLGDLSMILCDPHAVHTICLTILKSLQLSLKSEAMPRENGDIPFLLRLLSLGLQAWDIIDSQVFREQKPEIDLLIKFLPSLISVMVDDQVRLVHSNFPQDDDVTPDLYIRGIPETLTSYISTCPVASKLFLYYTLQVLRRQDQAAICRVLPTLVNSDNEASSADTFLHVLTSGLIIMADEFQHEEFCLAIFDDFFLSNLSTQNVRRHLLRLLWFVHTKVPPIRLANMMGTIRPTKEQSKQVHNAYMALSGKVEARINSPAVAADEKKNSPLMSVPPPTDQYR